jgi:hypothetical protein
MRDWISFLGETSKKARQPRILVYALLLTLLTLVVFQDRLPASVGLARSPGYIVGRLLLENGQAAQGAEIFFKVQKAFGASCYSKECDSFQNAIFRKRLSLAADGSFEIRIPGRYMNPSEENKAYVYTLVVRTPDGRFRPFYAFEIGRQERIVNEFVLRPPFLETLPGGETDIDSTF